MPPRIRPEPRPRHLRDAGRTASCPRLHPSDTRKGTPTSHSFSHAPCCRPRRATRPRGHVAAPARTSVATAKPKTVEAFYQADFNDKDGRCHPAPSRPHLAPAQPRCGRQPEGFRRFVASLHKGHPQSHSRIVRAFTNGDCVTLHVHAVRKPGTHGVRHPPPGQGPDHRTPGRQPAHPRTGRQRQSRAVNADRPPATRSRRRPVVCIRTPPFQCAATTGACPWRTVSAHQPRVSNASPPPTSATPFQPPPA